MLGLVALPLMRDMSLTHSQFGVVGSAFFLLFALSGIGVGLFADRLNMKWLLAGLALTWAVAQLPLAWPTSFAVLLACRILLGAGEGPASPLALHVVYTMVRRSRAQPANHPRPAGRDHGHRPGGTGADVHRGTLVLARGVPVAGRGGA